MTQLAFPWTPGEVEEIGTGIFESWSRQAGFGVAIPNNRASIVDRVVTGPRTLDIQIKAAATDPGFVVYKKYTAGSLNGPVVQVRIGNADGGPHWRDGTEMVVLDPDLAWALPAAAGLHFNPSLHVTYRWSRITGWLARHLEAWTARTPAELGQLLRTV